MLVGSKAKISMGIIALIIILLAIALTYYQSITHSKSHVSAITEYSLSISYNTSYTFVSFNGSRIEFSASKSSFLDLPLGTPIPVTSKSNTLVAANLSAFINTRMPKGFIETAFVYPNLTISTRGLKNYTTLILFSDNSVGDGDNIISVYANNGNMSIYTNGTNYYIENGSFKEYMFLYGNLTMMPNIIARGTTLNNSAVSENSPLFPRILASYLENITQISGLHFVSDGSWWYGGYFIAKINPTSLPPGYRKLTNYSIP